VLSGVRVAECATGIAGPYAGKLFADAGADVVKVEPAGGDPLRRWVASGHALAEGDDGPLFRFLNQSKRSLVDGDEGERVVAAADIVLVDGAPRHAPPPGQVVVSISPFGLDGPWAGRPATEFTLQAWCGSTGNRGMPADPPLSAGGRLGEYIGGSYAAVAALAALRVARATGTGEHVDLALLDCMCLTMNTYTTLFAQFLGWKPMPPGPARTIETPSIEPTIDGYVGFCTITAQQFQDFLVLIERPDLLDDAELATAIGRSKRLHEVLDIIHTWTTKHTTAECIELASLLRIPVALIGNGQSLLAMDHFADRGTFVPSADGAFRQPRVPYRIAGAASRPFAPAPALAADAGRVDWEAEPRAAPAAGRARPSLPLAGVRIVDFTAFWAGPAASMMLASLGADVVKIESAQRPDGMRFATTSNPKVPQWWEYGPVYHGANLNKRAVTIDLSRPQGIDLAKRLIAGADVVIENFSPRVMENFGLDWDEVHRVNPRAIMVRMPAFGLDGPWRDRTGFAQTMEQISGMAWVTGRRDGPPLIPRGACDPLAGMHAVFALMVALEQRDADGEGRLIEVTLVEAALNAAAEQVVEWTALGELLSRDTNRGPFARPQGVYPCAGEEQWLALAVATDEQWAACCRVMGLHPELRADHDAADAAIGDWCAISEVESAVDELLAAGVPAAVVVVARDIAFNPQLATRRFFEPVEHPVLGRIDVPSLPFRFASRVAAGEPWMHRAAPVLGQHNDEVLSGELGLTAEEMQALRDQAIIGDTMMSR
jgi:crotonobetainyl-CoA:carnitine CoA-transferase CaiB-like acyl-CoA transferase